MCIRDRPIFVPEKGNINLNETADALVVKGERFESFAHQGDVVQCIRRQSSFFLGEDGFLRKSYFAYISFLLLVNVGEMPFQRLSLIHI